MCKKDVEHFDECGKKEKEEKMNNIKEQIESILDKYESEWNYLDTPKFVTFYADNIEKVVLELTTLIDKVREEEIVKAFNFIQSEVEIPCVTTTGDTDKDIVIWAKANGFVDAVTLLDKKVKEYIQSIKEESK